MLKQKYVIIENGRPLMNPHSKYKTTSKGTQLFKRYENNPNIVLIPEQEYIINQKPVKTKRMTRKALFNKTGYKIKHSDFDKSILIYILDTDEDDSVNFNKPFEEVVENQKNNLLTIIQYEISMNKSIKVLLEFDIRVIRETDQEYQVESSSIKTKATVIMEGDIEHRFNELITELLEKQENYSSKGSGFVYGGVENILVHIFKVDLLTGGTYIELSDYYKNKNAIINIQNNDNECFRWCILRGLKNRINPKQAHKERVSDLKKFEHNVDFSKTPYPTPLSYIPTFVRNSGISINLFVCELIDDETKDHIYPYYIDKIDPEHAIDLLFYKGHYMLIESFTRLFNNGNVQNNSLYRCKRCFTMIKKRNYTESQYICMVDEHKRMCEQHEHVKITLPSKKNNKLSFKNYKKTNKLPYVIHADFESLLVKTDIKRGNTTKFQEHKAFQYGMTIVSTNENPVLDTTPFFYTGEDAVIHFLHRLNTIKEQITTIRNKKRHMTMTPEEQERLNKETHCCICNKKRYTFDDNDIYNKKDDNVEYKRVKRDEHGMYQGFQHKKCIYNEFSFIPVVFHNLKGYDAHLILQICNKINLGQTKVIPCNKEKYISFSLGMFRFIDSYAFMSDSLSNLISNLRDRSNDEAVLRKRFKNISTYFDKKVEGDYLSLITRKGVSPYEYLDTIDKMSETQLPPREAFYSSLSNEIITQEEYEHAQKVWSRFNCKTIQDYLTLYLEIDVLGQADVFESFRDVCYNLYGLEPLHYFTAPSLSWDAMLKYTEVEIELITDEDMLLFFETSKRGGLSMVFKRYAKANNKRMNDYDPGQPSSYITYLDANNLYGWAMSKPLPLKNFKWITLNTDNFLEELSHKQAHKGWTLEVNGYYPDDTHDKLRQLPPLPDKIVIPYDQLSPYNKEVLSKNNKKYTTGKKLIPSLYDRDNYIAHYSILKQAVELGFVITEILNVVEYDEEAFLEPYIQLNTNKRAQASNKFEKDFYKLMNNSIYGKTLQDERKHMDAKIVRTKANKDKYVNNVRFKNWTRWDDNYGMIELHKKQVELCKPLQIGATILDLSKTLMYDFYYNYIQVKYPDNELLMSDTDSFILKVYTENIYDDMKRDKDLYDMSEVKHLNYYDNTNEKVIGKFKSESGYEIIEEFVGLKSKMYSNRLGNNSQKAAIKGIKRAAARKYCGHDEFLRILSNTDSNVVVQNGIRSFKHNIYTTQQEKIGLGCLNDKTYMLEDGINYLPYGHKDI